jgi:hypothetical protein
MARIALGAWSLMLLPCGRDLPMHVGILSFNRPHYLRAVLDSLRVQVCERDEIVLVQDGAANPWSRRIKASRESIQHCIDLFRTAIPWGTVLSSQLNFGIALNYERAEKHFFETLRRPHALILEDDLVLSPQYLHVMQALLEIAQSEKRIAYVSAYGNMWASRAAQRRRQTELQHMHENWGFGMTREAWLDERPFREQYLALLAGKDYSERDHGRIFDFYRGRGWNVKFTSQDAARWIASVELGKVRLTTFACHARYIGETGEHSSPELYRECKFDRTVMIDTPVAKPSHPTSEQIEAWLEVERKRFKGELGAFYAGHGASAPTAPAGRSGLRRHGEMLRGAMLRIRCRLMRQ